MSQPLPRLKQAAAVVPEACVSVHEAAVEAQQVCVRQCPPFGRLVLVLEVLEVMEAGSRAQQAQHQWQPVALPVAVRGPAAAHKQVCRVDMSDSGERKKREDEERIPDLECTGR